MKTTNNPTAKLQRMKKMREGLVKKFPLGTELILIRGVQQPASAVIQGLDERIRIYQDAEDAHKDLKTKVQARDEAETATDAFLDDIRVGVTPFFGATSQELTDFGFLPKKPRRELTVEQRAERKAKAKLTRKMRGTMGRRQKEHVKAGNLPQAPSQGAQPAAGTEPTNPSTGHEAGGGAGR